MPKSPTPLQIAREAKRLQILTLKELDLKNAEIAKRLSVNEATVRTILKRYGPSMKNGGSPDVKDAKRSGRPPKYSPRYIYDGFGSFFFSLFLGFRVERALVRIGEKHDFYGAQAIADEYHREMMEAMKQKKAPGSVVEVFAFFGGQ